MPPSGNGIRASGIEISRMESGKIAEQWTVLDVLGILTQVGAIPPMAAVEV